MPNLFISRSLSPSSPLLAWAYQQEIKVMAQSLLRFSPIPFELPSIPFDWIFFYSPRAVEFFWAPIAIGQGAQRARQAKIATIGHGTAKALDALGYTVNFIGNGQPEATALDFAKIAKGQTILFPRAQQSKRSVEHLLGKTVQSIDLVVYQNEAIPPIHQIAADIVVLTSPLNVKAWMATHPSPDPKIDFIAIGHTTATALKEYNIEAIVPDSPSETGILEVVKQLL